MISRDETLPVSCQWRGRASVSTSGATIP